MKRKFLILISILTLSCSKNANSEDITLDENNEPQKTEREILKEKWGIPEDVNIRYIDNWNPDNMIILGKKDYTVYFYKIEKGEAVAKHIEKLPKKEIEINIGYGEKETIDLKNSYISQYKFDNIFTLRLSNSNTDRYGYYYWIYNNGSFINIDLENILIDHYRNFYIIRLYNNTLISINNKYFLLDENWNRIYTSKKEGLLKLDENTDIFTINSNSIILFNIKERASHNIQRIDLKEEKIAWREKSFLPYEDKDARIYRKEIAKKDNIWTFTFNYTLYSGEKKVKIIKININNGEIIE